MGDKFVIKFVNGHIEVYDNNGKFKCGCDNDRELKLEINHLEQENIV